MVTSEVSLLCLCLGTFREQWFTSSHCFALDLLFLQLSHLLRTTAIQGFVPRWFLYCLMYMGFRVPIEGLSLEWSAPRVYSWPPSFLHFLPPLTWVFGLKAVLFFGVMLHSFGGSSSECRESGLMIGGLLVRILASAYYSCVLGQRHFTHLDSSVFVKQLQCETCWW